MSTSTRTAIVTGAGSGIGAAVARALGRAGMKVVVTGGSGRELERAAAAVRDAGGEALAVVADLAEPTEVERVVVEATRAFGPADILVNTAAVAEAAPLERTDDALWDRHMLTNLTAAFWLCRAVAPRMAERGWGRIVNVASAAAERGAPNTAAYAASKAGLLGLTRALAAELGPRGVAVNAVCPGWLDPPHPRAADAPDVASLVAYLCSDEGSALSGGALVLDGVRPDRAP